MLSLKIPELRVKWNKNKEYYKTHELGTGVQSFVKDVFLSEQVFDLIEGSGDTPDDRRKNEFIHEKRAKERRRTDFAIYINPEIVIPVEAETYGNIENGLKQLQNYQRDFDKKYGILTDGFTWRFYNNNRYREFKISDILENASLFLDFWKEYIKPEYYYLSFFEKIDQLSMFKKEDTLLLEENRQRFFEDITTLIESFKNKLQIEGYFTGLNKKERNKKATEITYSYIIQFILYKTLVDNDFGTFREEFEDKVEKIHKYIKSKRYKDILGIIDGISNEISENIYFPFTKEQDFIAKKIKKLFHIENELSDVSPWLDIFLFIKKYNFQNIQSEIFGYVYENYLKELFEEEKLGQYFTDPVVVRFMLKQIGYTPENIKRKVKAGKLDKLSINDPACGSGTFLYSAVDNIINAFSPDIEKASKQIQDIIINNVFGLDIEEFPLYLAEMNILMRMLPLIISEKYNNPVDKKIKLFLTNDSTAEFIGSGIGFVTDNTKVDVDIRNGQMRLGLIEQEPEVESFMRDASDIQEMKRSLRRYNEIPRRRYDYVIGNPPYISYNKAVKQGFLIFDFMKKGRVKLNNIYGMNLHSTPENPKKRPPKPNFYAFFIAMGIALLKDDAKFCYIIPQTLLNAGDLDVLRYHLAKFVTIEKIITFNNNLFISRGLKRKKIIPTSSLVFIINKNKPSKNHETEIINYEDSQDTIEDTINNILSEKKINRKNILQSDLLENFINWNFIKQSKELFDFYKEYKSNTTDISIYYDHKKAQNEFSTKFYFDIGYNIDESKALERLKNIDIHYQLPRLNDKYWMVREFKGYWPNIRSGKSSRRIKLLLANQEYKLLDSEHKILWSYTNPARFHFSSDKIIWPRNQICAVGSENKKELFYLFGILNSNVINKILLSKLKTEKEKDLLVSISSVKEYIRVPRINKYNQHIKDEIIRSVNFMLILEEKILADFVDFTGVIMQKFDEVKVKKDNLLLIYNDKTIKLQIKGYPELISEAINSEHGQDKLNIKKNKINLYHLKNLPIIDFNLQRKLKDYIDGLVFTLYFNIPLKSIGLKNSNKVKQACQKSKFYKVLGK